MQRWTWPGLRYLLLLWGCVTLLVLGISGLLDIVAPQMPEVLRTALLTAILAPLLSCWLSPCLQRLTVKEDCK